MIQSGRAGLEGSTVELRRGDHVIVARVVWREGPRAGLQADERIPIEEIMSLSRSGTLRLVAGHGGLEERRKQKRRPDADARLRGRAIEFIGLGLIAVSLALGVWASAQEAFARPKAKAEAALAG
jgi:hypothetical protein